MAISLQNLVARPPRLKDLSDVTKLHIASDIAEDGMSDYTEEELLADWQRPGFILGRGIGTLLLRLAEHRARQYVKQAPSGLRVVLHSAVSAINQEAKDLLEQEGYTPVSRFWRMMIDADESADGSYQQGKLKFDLFLEAQHLAGIAQEQQRTGIYVARQYDVFEKELRPGENLLTCKELPVLCNQ